MGLNQNIPFNVHNNHIEKKLFLVPLLWDGWHTHTLAEFRRNSPPDEEHTFVNYCTEIAPAIQHMKWIIIPMHIKECRKLTRNTLGWRTSDVHPAEEFTSGWRAYTNTFLNCWTEIASAKQQMQWIIIDVPEITQKINSSEVQHKILHIGSLGAFAPLLFNDEGHRSYFPKSIGENTRFLSIDIPKFQESIAFIYS